MSKQFNEAVAKAAEYGSTVGGSEQRLPSREEILFYVGGETLDDHCKNMVVMVGQNSAKVAKGLAEWEAFKVREEKKWSRMCATTHSTKKDS